MCRTVFTCVALLDLSLRFFKVEICVFPLGSPKPTVRWLYGGKEIKIGGRYSVACDGDLYSLHIKDVTEADSGTYRCVAKSSAGEAYHDMEVKVAPKVYKPMYVLV